jgi:hypothetical protein
MQGAIRGMSINSAHASLGASGTSNELSNSISSLRHGRARPGHPDLDFKTVPYPSGCPAQGRA